jgi:hypothetical protein
MKKQGRNVLEAIQSVFGWTLEDLDAHWKAFVRANYANK